MANNEYINKVEYGNDTLIDLTSDTVTEDTLVEGYTAHTRSGATITGTLGDATTSTHGLMSAADKDKLNKLLPDTSNIIVENTPYNFRITGGGEKVCNRETEKLVGGTVAWNQLVQKSNLRSRINYNVSIMNNNNGSITISTEGTASGTTYLDILNNAINVIINHKYLFIGSTSTIKFAVGGSVKNIYNADSITCMIGLSIASGSSYSGTIYPMFFDLTAMFGSTIADYIFSLEQGTAGAGVAWFRDLFPKDYYAYDAGSLQSVQAKSHVTRGFNQWDGTYENGKWLSDTNGNISSEPSYCLTGFIPVLPSTIYYKEWSNSGRSLQYDYNKNVIPNQNWNDITPNSGLFTTKDNAYYVRFTIQNNFVSQFIINLHWDGERDGEYEPYAEHTYPLDADLTLRGIPKLDSNNKLYYDGDTYESDGTVTRRYGIVDLGSLNWVYVSDHSIFYSDVISNMIYTTEVTDRNKGIISSKYPVSSVINLNSSMIDKSMLNNMGRIYIRDTGYSDGTTFKAAMSGVYLIYELATPTTETADPYNNIQICDGNGTEEYIDTRDVAIPVGHETKYYTFNASYLTYLPELEKDNTNYSIYQSNNKMILKPLLPMTGATSSVAGASGLVPAPTTGDTSKYLKGDGTWADTPSELPPVTSSDNGKVLKVDDGSWQKGTFSNATQSAAGLMSSTDKTKLDGIATGANKPVILMYNTSTWNDFITAYTSGATICCYAEGATNGQYRIVQLAYVNNRTNPTLAQFQYYRATGNKTTGNSCDQLIQYSLDSTSGWSVETKYGGPKTITATNGISVSFSNNDMTISGVEATTSAAGMMSAADKTKLDNMTTNGQASFDNATTSTAGLMSAADKTKLDGIATGATADTVMTGATSSVAGTSGLVPAPTTTDVNKFLAGDGTYKSGGLPMVILLYGNSTWADFETAYNNNVIVYCRASNATDPSTGNQNRMAFMAYVNDASSPTEVEFQYYRSVSSHSATALNDEVFVYKLNKTSGWSVTKRYASLRQIIAGTGMEVSYNNNQVTVSSVIPAPPTTNGTYTLQVVVADDTPTYSWV